MRMPLIAAIVIACAGCDGSWQWRDRTYALPEQALEAQRKDLDREVEHVTKVIQEDRLPGQGLALLPTRPVLLRLTKAKDAEQGTYRAGLAANDAAAGVNATQRAELFARGCQVAEVADPDDAEIAPEVRWVLLYLPSTKDGLMHWWLNGVEQERYLQVPDVPATGEDRLDRFVDSVQDSARKLRAGEGFAWTRGSVVRHPQGGRAWLPGTAMPETTEIAASHDALRFTLGADRGMSSDRNRLITAVIQVQSQGGLAGPMIDLPPISAATRRVRLLVGFGGTSRIVEIQAGDGRVAFATAQGPKAALQLVGKGERDLKDDDLAPDARRVLGSLRLDP